MSFGQNFYIMTTESELIIQNLKPCDNVKNEYPLVAFKDSTAANKRRIRESLRYVERSFRRFADRA